MVILLTYMENLRAGVLLEVSLASIPDWIVMNNTNQRLDLGKNIVGASHTLISIFIDRIFPFLVCSAHQNTQYSLR